MKEIKFTRIDLIQLFIDKLNADVYLEIGVHTGKSFLSVKCMRKIGVDPDFKIKLRKKFRHSFTNFIRFLSKNSKIEYRQYHETTSDNFFAQYKRDLALEPPKVVFIDGLHTFKQTLKDCYNSLNCLADGGVIVLHDCNPPTEASATPALSIEDAEKKWKDAHPSPEVSGAWIGEWCGDTWKIIPYLIKNHPELNVCVLDSDYGLGIVSKRKSYSHSPYQICNDIGEYANLDFSYLIKNREKILNLKQLGELDEILSLYCPRPCR